MSYRGVGRMFLLKKDGKFNAHMYQNAIPNLLLPSAVEWFPDGDNLVQGDGSPRHQARSVIAMTDQLNIPSLDW